jgi:hypothetical protein
MQEGTMMTTPANGQETIICVTHDNHSKILKATGHSYNIDTGRSENFEPGMNLAHFDDQGRLTRLMLLDQASEDPNPRRHCVDPTHNTFLRCRDAFVAVEPIRDAEINKWWIPRRLNSEAEDGPIPPWAIRDDDNTAGEPEFTAGG